MILLLSQGSGPLAGDQLAAHQLSDLHRIQGSSLAQVVARNEHDQPLAVRRGLISPDPPHQTRILARRIQRRRHVHQSNARRLREQLGGPLRAEIISEFRVHSEGVPGENGHPYAGSRHPKIGNVQDLPRLSAQLLLFVGLTRAVIDDLAGERKDVVGNGFGIFARLREVERPTVEGEFGGAIDYCFDLRVELVHARPTRS